MNVVRIKYGVLGFAWLALLSGGASAQPPSAQDAELRRYYREVVEMCHLGGATLRRINDERFRLSLPRRLYSARRSDRVHGRIMCVDHWALEHGADLDVRRLRR